MSTAISLTDSDGDTINVGDLGRGRTLIEVVNHGSGSSEAVALSPKKLIALRDALTVIIDAPRLAARKDHEEVERAEGSGVALVKTKYEWGVGNIDTGDVEWHPTEDEARGPYRKARNVVVCELCGVEVDEDKTDAIEDESGGRACEKHWTEAGK